VDSGRRKGGWCYFCARDLKAVAAPAVKSSLQDLRFGLFHLLFYHSVVPITDGIRWPDHYVDSRTVEVDQCQLSCGDINTGDHLLQLIGQDFTWTDWRDVCLDDEEDVCSASVQHSSCGLVDRPNR
jgi:hypothetical protein